MRKYSGKNLKVYEDKQNLGNIPEPIPTCLPEDVNYQARIAIYDTLLSIPQIKEITSGNARDFIEKLSAETYHIVQQQGGKIPYTLIREVVENLIHAYFKDPVITILQKGNILRISDRGKGIKDKEKVLLPGFTTASYEMKKYIRGVGSGLAIVLETLKFLGGVLTIEDNLEEGTVITISLAPDTKEVKEEVKTSNNRLPPEEVLNKLSIRQKKLLILIGELEEAGPSEISREMKIGVSTSFKELDYLEKKGLLRRLNNGKRHLTDKGLEVLELIFRE